MSKPYDEDSLAKTYMPIILKRFRKAAGLSQRNLAYGAGISKSYITSLESGERAPNLNLLVKLADTLGVKAGVMVDAMVEEAIKSCNDKEKE